MNLFDLIGSAKNLSKNLEGLKQEIEKLEITGEAGGGMVKVIINGKKDVKNIDVSNTSGDLKAEMVAELIASALRDASAKVDAAVQEKVKLMLPPGMPTDFLKNML